MEGWKRRPPLHGPKAWLNCTRKPRLTCASPLSSIHGTLNTKHLSGSNKRSNIWTYLKKHHQESCYNWGLGILFLGKGRGGESYWEFFTKTGSIEWTTSWIDCINSASCGSFFETDSSIEAAVFDKAEMENAQFRSNLEI
jgi:hypothetical protein